MRNTKGKRKKASYLMDVYRFINTEAQIYKQHILELSKVCFDVFFLIYFKNGLVVVIPHVSFSFLLYFFINCIITLNLFFRR